MLSLSACGSDKQGDDPAPNVGKGTGKRPKLPIEYMASYNVGASPLALASSDKWQESGYFTLEEAERIDIEGYHLPTPEEMNGIIPIPHKNQKASNPNGYPKVYVGVPKEWNAAPPILIRDEEEVLQVGKERLNCTSLYGVVGAYTNRRISYALRFWDEGERKYYSAFRYEIQPLVPVRRIEDKLAEYRLQIRVRYLGKDSPLRLSQSDMEKVCSEAFWAKDADRDIVRYLPNCGYIFDPASGEQRPSSLEPHGRYWLQASQEVEGRKYRYVELSNSAVGMGGHHLFSRLPIRLFSDK